MYSDDSGDSDAESVCSPATVISISSDLIELSDDEEEEEEEQRAPSSSPSEPPDPYLPPDAKQ
jgi:hypothetical protein